MSEDYEAACDQALALFERTMNALTKINPAPWRRLHEIPPFYATSSPETMLDVLERHFLSIGDRLLLGSRHTLVDRLTQVRRHRATLLLLGNGAADCEAHGYLVRPKAMYFIYGPKPQMSCVVIDNAPKPRDPFDWVGEEIVTAEHDQKHLDLVNLQTGHNPLMLFPYGSLFVLPEARDALADILCTQDIDKYSRP
jgi:hypothetical protein